MNIEKENDIFPTPKPDTFIDLDKFNRSRNYYKKRKHGSNFRASTLNVIENAEASNENHSK